jgi:membrane protein DedA with SNARE-associated domain
MLGIFQGGLVAFEHYVAAYGVWALFVILYFESFGVPLPGESALLTSSLLAVRGDLNIEDVFLAAWAAGVLGDSTGYLIGRFGGRVLLERFGPYVKLTPERLDKFEDQFRKRGFLIVMGARFVAILRQLNGIVAGSAGMKWHHFVVANALGAALWAALWSFGPYYFTDFFRKVI